MHSPLQLSSISPQLSHQYQLASSAPLAYHTVSYTGMQQTHQQPQAAMLNQNGYAYQTPIIPTHYQQPNNYVQQYQMTALAPQHQQQQSSQPILSEKPTIKMEPIEPQASTHYTNAHTNEDNQQKNILGQVSVPYFTNPVAFKQEPSEPSISQNSTLANTISLHEPPASAQSGIVVNGSNDNEKDALTLVNKLLKDKQILNQLEKVAQSFKHPTSSIYQDNWSFQATQPSPKSSTSPS
jgi:hypothetical protein